MAKSTSNLPINYEEQLAKEAAEIAKRIAAPSGDRIRFNGSVGFITPDGNEGEALDVVIIDFLSSNLFYDGPFDRENPQPPACFAIGDEPSHLVPSPNSPNKQSDTCASCSMNQFGSAGNGKACKNTRLLAVVPAAALDDPDTETPVWILSVPPASLRHYDAYVKSLAAKHKTVPTGVITNIVPDKTVSYAAPRFNVVRPLAGKELGVFMTRREEARSRLVAEPDVSQYVPPKKATGPGAQVRRGVR